MDDTTGGEAGRPGMETPAADDARSDADAAERRQIGPYRLVRKLGEGGMGLVWLAEQESPVRRTVALKVIKHGMDTRRVIARFEAERQALAMMDHPAIAHVLDAGETPRGRPYFVMEYVRGVPITEYCDRHSLNLRQRLLLFHKVCEGVQHAHQKAVIHRDLKPSNILVTEQQGRAVPKIIDFGVAKATAQRLTDASLHTELGQMIGTPEFMSPEQAELTGEDVDTRSDVYSLGAVLYTLLVGALPFDPEALRNEGPEALRRRICHEDPPLPSVRLRSLAEASQCAALRGTDAAALERRLGGELDWIVMKAMDKDRNRRYGSPAELAEDLGRHLDNVPVKAHPPSTVYRVTKFVRRHRAGVTLAAAALLFLLVFAAGMTLQTRRVIRERDQKETALAEAQAVSAFVTEMLVAVDPLEGGADVTVRQVLDSASEELASAFPGQPAVEARVRTAIGRGYHSLGLNGAAEETLRTAHTLRRGVLGPEHPETLETESALALVLYRQGRYDEAAELLRELLEVRARTLPAEHPRRRWAQNNLALTYLALGRYEEAESLFTAARDAAARDPGGASDELRDQTLAIEANLAVFYHQQGRHAKAEELYRRSLAVQESTLGRRHPDTLMTRNNLGEVLADQGRDGDAVPILVEVLEDKRQVFGDDHPGTLYTMELLARVYAGQGRRELAEPLLVEAWEDRVRTLGAEHPDSLRARATLDAFRAGGGAPGP